MFLPQMAPYNWLILFFLFNMIMMFIMSHNHFMFITSFKCSNFKLINNNFKWLW